eukprot:NODE_1897_length_1341_cov_31.234761_g1802_i0.p1 GENE.NODE_1897_length_1341_cov_31.234761_g1802_i0~~NODE_1897_length_1341_cov_31.234761_g1802_i0.p1  ORF type:complete len:417 (+),score=96.37 NODE_1897_length_1341_cov_31.234761_g1802_i0:37-1251(+)
MGPLHPRPHSPFDSHRAAIFGFPEHGIPLNGVYHGQGDHYRLGDCCLALDHNTNQWTIAHHSQGISVRLAYSEAIESDIPPALAWYISSQYLQMVEAAPFVLLGTITVHHWVSSKPLLCPPEDRTGASASALPSCVLSHVLSFLPFFSLLAARCVCTTWAGLTGNELWRPVCHSLFPFFDWGRSMVWTAAECYHSNARQPPPPTTEQSYFTMFWQLLRGQRTCLTQVIDKHLERGYMLTAYDGYLFFSQPGMWEVIYLQPPVPRHDHNKRHFFSEIVDENRLRHFPPDLGDYDPYRHHFTQAFQPSAIPTGSIVEMQFRFREGDPYGWWQGHLDHWKPEGTLLKAVISFPQYDALSPWAKEEVVWGSENLKSRGGQSTGGLRLCTKADQSLWQQRKATWGVSKS